MKWIAITIYSLLLSLSMVTLKIGLDSKENLMLYIVNANGASKLIKSRSILVSTSEYDDLDIDNNDDI